MKMQLTVIAAFLLGVTPKGGRRRNCRMRSATRRWPLPYSQTTTQRGRTGRGGRKLDLCGRKPRQLCPRRLAQ